MRYPTAIDLENTLRSCRYCAHDKPVQAAIGDDRVRATRAFSIPNYAPDSINPRIATSIHQ